MPTRATRRRSPWRGPGLVDWSLYDDPEQTAAQAELDRAFARTVVWLRVQLIAGLPAGPLVAEAFDRIGPTMHRWGALGAVDTEPCANVRLALAAMASPPRQQRRVLH